MGPIRPVVLDEHDSPDSNRIRFVRNHAPLGPSGARNAGIEVASGDLVTFLDDDDLLAGNALELIATAFRKRADLDCLFVNVDPFGELAEGTLENQTRVLYGGYSRNWVWTRGRQRERWRFPAKLFEVLLDGVPMAFQRVAIRRSALSRVGHYIGRGFEDIEFYFRVALRCTCALLADAVYRPRCARTELLHADRRQGGPDRLLDSCSRRSAEASGGFCEARLQRCVRRTLADAHFEKTYFAYETGKPFPWRDYFASCATGITWPHVSILLKNVARSLSGKKMASTRT